MTETLSNLLREERRFPPSEDRPFPTWSVGGRLNVAYDCVDRHVEAGHGDQVAWH